MKKKILSALVALMAVAGCDAPQKPVTLRPQVKKEQPVAARPAPKPDAGQLTQAEPPPAETPKDTLALEHDQPKVDHFARAEELKGIGDFGGALTEARRALFTDPEDEDVLAFIAKIAPRVGKSELAAEAFGRISEMHPEDAVPLIAQARAFISAKNYPAAMASGRAAVKLDAENVEAWHALGRAHLSSGDLQSAIVAFEKAVEVDPNHGYALNNLGLAYLRANENAAAAQVLERAVELLPHVAYVQNNLGVAYERLGHVDEAKEAYSRATALSPKYVKAKVNSARVAKAIIDPDEPLPEDVNALPENPIP